MLSRLNTLWLFVCALCLSTIAGSMYAWNETDILPPPQQHTDLVAADNDSSSAYYSDDLMPDMGQKPGGGFAGTLGEMLITLPLFNEMDREAAEQKWSYIVSFPLDKKNEKPEVSTDQSAENPGQTAKPFDSTVNTLSTHTGSDGDGQPPNQGLIQHTHGACCHALGCNGGHCRCKECSSSLTGLPSTKKREADRNTDEKKDQPVANIIQRLRQREVEGTPLSACWLAGLSQDRLSSGMHRPVYEYTIPASGFNNIGVLPDGRIVFGWGASETLRVWSPQNFMPQGYSYGRFNADFSAHTHGHSTYEVTSIVFFIDFRAFMDTLRSGEPSSQPVSNSHFVPLSGHTNEIRGVFVKRDGRIVTWSKDQTIRIWTEHNGRWFSVKTEVDKEIHYAWTMRELSDGRLRFYNSSSRTTLILSDHGYGLEYETIDGSVGELRDGRLYQWTPEGMRIWRQDSNEASSYLRLDLPLYSYSLMYLQLEDGRIITRTMEGSLSGRDSYIRLWTEQKDRTWTPYLLGRYLPSGIIPINNKRLILYDTNSFLVISEAGDQWISSDRISVPRSFTQYRLHVLKNEQIVMTGESFGKYRHGALIWTEHQDQWRSESLIDESGTPIIFDHVIMLQDGRWVSWSDRSVCELRIWAYIDEHYSSILLSGLPGHPKVFELPGGWLVAVSSSSEYSTLKVWNLFPERGKPQK